MKNVDESQNSQKKSRRLRKAAQIKTLTVEEMMAQRFDRLEEKLDGFKDEINAWKQEFVKQLTKLNTNMEQVLNQLADHEGRITKLEQKHIKAEARNETISDMAKFGWTAAKIALAVGAVIGAVGGCGWILKILAVI